MEQYDGTVVDTGQELGIGLLRCGLVVHIPVHIRKAPQNGLVAQGLGLPQILHIVFSLGRAVVFAHGLAGGLLEEGLQGLQLLLESGLVADGGHIRVVIGVVAHHVPLRHHAADQVRGGLDHVARHKEGRRGVVLFQRVQNGGGIAVFIAAVKGEVDHLLTGIAQVIGVVLGQFLHSGISHGRLALGGEGESPVVGGDGNGGISGGRQGGGLPAHGPEQHRQKQQHRTKERQRSRPALKRKHERSTSGY